MALLCALALSLGAQAQSPDPLVTQHAAALNQARADFQEKRIALFDRYALYVEGLLKAAQEEGDLDTYLVLRDEISHAREKRTLPETPPPLGLDKAREILSSELETLQETREQTVERINTLYVAALETRIQELTREENLAAALELSGIRDRVAERLTPAPRPGRPPPRLGPNLVAGGSFDDEAADGWALRIPGGERNRTEIYSEPNSNRNKALRIHQHSSGHIRVSRGIPLKEGAKYQVRWRARLLKPWRPGAEIRGTGGYSIGFEIPGDIYNALPPPDQMNILQQVFFHTAAPSRTEWQSYSRTLRAQPFSTTLILHFSPGEGEFILDDLEINEILPEQEN